MNTKQKAGTPLVKKKFKKMFLKKFLFNFFFQRDIKLQHRVLHWMIGLLGEKPKVKTLGIKC